MLSDGTIKTQAVSTQSRQSMIHTSIICLTLFHGTAAGFGQTASPDAQLTQILLTEIGQLRQDLQITAATIQRVQILMYRVQTEASQLNRVTERLDIARTRCSQVQSQRKMLTAQIENAAAGQRNSQNPSDRKTAEEMAQGLKSAVEMLDNQDQQCRVEQADAEAQFRTEQAKMDDLQNQLDNLDKVLAAQGRSKRFRC
jgi:chromosome segregation ATPase